MAFLSLPSVASAELVTLVTTPQKTTNTLVLVAGQSAECIYKLNWNSASRATVTTPGATFQIDVELQNVKVAGPATITFSGNQTSVATMLTFDVKSASASPTSVIPKGEGAIIELQCSENLTNEWTTIFAQAYTNAPSHKFLRLRLTRL